MGRMHFLSSSASVGYLRHNPALSNTEFCQWRMWSIAKLLLYCANYSIKLQSNEFFVTKRSTASDAPYSEKNGCKVNFFVCVALCGVFCGFVFGWVFLMKLVVYSGHLEEYWSWIWSLCYCFSYSFLFLGCDFQSSLINWKTQLQLSIDVYARTC